MSILEILEIAITLIFIASLVGIVLRRLRMPYTVGLVLVGLGLALINPFIQESGIEISPEDVQGLILPEVILGLLVPPLVFEAAFHIKFDELRRNLVLILAFAIPGVVLTMFMVGGVVAWGTGLALPVALVFGALIAATDPVAVVALFRSLGVPKRLQTLLEGESLFNDGTAIVIFNLMVGLVAAGGRFSLTASLLEFLQVAVGGVIVGLAIGWVVSFAINRIDDYSLEITLTLVAVYGSYLIAERFHVAGVLAVVTTGLVSGNIGHRGMSPTTRIALFNFWEYAAFVANSFVFLVIGLVINVGAMLVNWRAILLAILAVLAARAVVIYLFSWISNDVQPRLQHVLYWGGLRGAISLALALSLQAATVGPDVNLLQDMAFGVVLFTLLVQGTTMPSLIQRLKLIQRTEIEEKYELHQARAVAARSAYDHISELSEQGLISRHTWSLLEEPMQRQMDAWTRSVRDILHQDRSVEISEVNNAYQEALRAQRSAYNNLFFNGAISEENFSKLVAEIDYALTSNQVNYADIFTKRPAESPPITRMLAAVLGGPEIEGVLTMMNVLGIPFTELESSTGFGSAPVTTLFIGVEEGLEDEVVELLGAYSQDLVEAPPGLLDRVLPMQPTEDRSVNGMQIFSFDVEHYEEI